MDVYAKRDGWKRPLDGNPSFKSFLSTKHCAMSQQTMTQSESVGSKVFSAGAEKIGSFFLRPGGGLLRKSFPSSWPYHSQNGQRIQWSSIFPSKRPVTNVKEKKISTAQGDVIVDLSRFLPAQHCYKSMIL
ncbi:unnamed protein product [Caretta caretta]